MAHKTNAETNLKRFSSEEARRNGKKGAESSAKIRRAKRDCLDPYKLAMASTSDKELQAAINNIKKFAQRGSLPHWQEWLRLIGQMETTDTEMTVVIKGGEDLAK